MRGTLYALSVVSTAVMGGFMLVYRIVLGRYFNYLLEQRRFDGFTDLYAPFRKARNPVTPYFAVSFAQFGFSLAYAVTTLRLTAFLACLPFILLVTLHTLTGFSKAEKAINSGEVRPQTVQTYLRFNLPLHAFYTFTYLGSASVTVIAGR